MKEIEVVSGQSLIDIAIQEYGCYEGIFLLAEDNGISISKNIQKGDKLLIRDEVPELTTSNQKMAEIFEKGLRVACKKDRRKRVLAQENGYPLIREDGVYVLVESGVVPVFPGRSGNGGILVMTETNLILNFR